MTTLVVGLDGGGFELVEPWLEAGELPTLARLRREGVAADSTSYLPPVTCPNWQCYATGTNPGKLGVFWWERVDRAAENIENTNTSTAFDGSYFWELFDGSHAIVNLPTSYPPTSSDGIHVAGGPGAQQTGFTAPASLEATLRRDYDYRVHPDQLSLLSRSRTDSDCIEEIYDLIDSRFAVVEDCLDEGYEFVHLTVFYLNVLQHFYWDHDVVKAAWQRIDSHIERLVASPAVDHTFVISDHGSNEIHTAFRINSWLTASGYLVLEEGVSQWFHDVGLTQERLRPLLARLGVEWWARRLVPERLQMLLPQADGSVDKSGKAAHIDWEASTAIASGQGPLYVLAQDPEERRRLREELADQLLAVTDETGRSVLEGVSYPEDIYTGPYVTDGPDLLLEQAPHVHIEGKVGAEETLVTPQTWRAENTDTGLFIAHGPTIDPDGTTESMHIADIAPTILHLHDVAVPERFDGTVQTGLFAPGSDPASRPPRRMTLDETATRPDATVSTDVSDRLDDLGYLE